MSFHTPTPTRVSADPHGSEKNSIFTTPRPMYIKRVGQFNACTSERRNKIYPNIATGIISRHRIGAPLISLIAGVSSSAFSKWPSRRWSAIATVARIAGISRGWRSNGSQVYTSVATISAITGSTTISTIATVTTATGSSTIASVATTTC